MPETSVDVPHGVCYRQHRNFVNNNGDSLLTVKILSLCCLFNTVMHCVNVFYFFSQLYFF